VFDGDCRLPGLQEFLTALVPHGCSIEVFLQALFIQFCKESFQLFFHELPVYKKQSGQETEQDRVFIHSPACLAREVV
jgi:hypothetical protein